tara:strand:+ start:518 stop:1534 length:1017 start_codon:yes stop_codon:yes gene_type:complete
MDIYQFLENADVYLQPSAGTNTYKLDITPEGVSFSQTFTEKTYARKTLHQQSHNVQEGSISKANPADFSFTIPLLKENDFDTVFNLLVDLNSSNTLDTFNLFFLIDNTAYVIEKCVFTNGNFPIGNSAPLSVQLSGQGTRLYTYTAPTTGIHEGKIVDSLGNISAVFSAQTDVPKFTTANIVARSSTRTFLPLTEVMLIDTYVAAGSARSKSLASLNIELQNRVNWISYTTVHKRLGVTDNATSQYPDTFSLGERTLAGNASVYIGKDSAPTLNWQQSQVTTIVAYSRLNNTNYGLKLTAPLNITTRVTPGSVLKNDKDWRLASNADTISNYFTYTTA